MTFLQRTRLLDQVTTTSSHVLLCAPSGYGKTVLQEQLAQCLPGAVHLTAVATDTA